MSRKISQSSVSSYFAQSISSDIKVFRQSPIVQVSFQEGQLVEFVTGICMSGACEFEIQGKRHKLRANHIFCVLPGHKVRLVASSDDCLTDYAVISRQFAQDITSRFPNVMFDYLTANPTMPMTPTAMVEAMCYFDLIEAKISERGNLFQKDIIFNILYSYTLDLYNMINRDLPNLPLGKTATERIFDKFSVLVHLHIKETRRVAYYADQLNITPKHLSKVVKQIKGVSAKNWLNEHLLFEVKQTLVGTSMSIQEVSDIYSFSSADAFHHFFNNATGMSPSAFRQQNIR